jgi:uroporphyrinogen decarboxylase
MKLEMIKALRREKVSHVPVDVFFCESQENAFKNRFGHDDYQGFFEMFHRPVYVDIKKKFDDGNKLYPREELPKEIEFDAYGVGHSKGSEAAYHMTMMHHPLKGADLEEIKNYPYPGINDGAQDKLNKEVSALHDSNKAAMGLMTMTTWEAAWYLRSMEELMIDMLMGDEKATYLLDNICKFSCDLAEHYAKADTDILALGDDIGTQSSTIMDVPTWQTWLKPRLKKVIDTARAIKPDILIYFHSCGFVTPFIDDLIEIGVDILNPVQPESMEFNEIYDKYGDRISFWGTLGTQKLLPFGTSEEVYDTTYKRLKKCNGTGIVIGPTHTVEPEVPWENLLAYKQAVKDFEQNILNS